MIEASPHAKLVANYSRIAKLNRSGFIPGCSETLEWVIDNHKPCTCLSELDKTMYSSYGYAKTLKAYELFYEHILPVLIELDREGYKSDCINEVAYPESFSMDDFRSVSSELRTLMEELGWDTKSDLGLGYSVSFLKENMRFFDDRYAH